LGAIIFVRDLRDVPGEHEQPFEEPPPSVTEVEVTEKDEPVMTEGIKHALNCTYDEYRRAHFDECVGEPSRIYARPEADPDDTGYVSHGSPVLYASLIDSQIQ
jgi:hypothetical protein